MLNTLNFLMLQRFIMFMILSNKNTEKKKEKNPTKDS